MPPFDLIEANVHGLAPLELLAVPARLDGSEGTNRSAGHCQLTATTDIDAVRAWLARVADKKSTFDNYRKEVERLMLWAMLQLGKPISSLTHEDVIAYELFLADPQPAERWVLTGKRKWGRDHPNWRPFSGPLSPASRKQALIIIGALFTWLTGAGYLAGSPLLLSKRKRDPDENMRVTRYLEEDLWLEVKATIVATPQTTPRERSRYRRTRWLFSLLYLCGLRISEVTGNSMGSFMSRTDKNGVQRWWLQVLGKGDKLRLVPATDELMNELIDYRRDRGLSPLPVPGESTPLLLPLSSAEKPLTRGAVHGQIKQVFELTAKRLEARGEAGRAMANRARLASAHWLRHTAGSNMANGSVDLRHVRDTLGHASISTTSIYLHGEDDQRHIAVDQGHKIRW